MSQRLLLAAAVLSAAALVATGAPLNAQRGANRPTQDETTPPAKPKKPASKASQRGRPQTAPPQAAPQPQGRAQGRQEPPPSQSPQGRARGHQEPQRLPHQQQQALISLQQERLSLYIGQLNQQQRVAPQRAQQLQQQHRPAQSRIQLTYIAGLRDQQLRLQRARNHNYGGDPFFSMPSTYRYARDGRYYETNDYGAKVLRQAVNTGYDQGFQVGRADRQDHWRYDYQTSYGYQDGNYGFDGFYVDRYDYNYYFRQGFSRGYDDGYYSRTQYGGYDSGRYTVLGGVLAGLLSLLPIR